MSLLLLLLQGAADEALVVYTSDRPVLALSYTSDRPVVTPSFTSDAPVTES